VLGNISLKKKIHEVQMPDRICLLLQFGCILKRLGSYNEEMTLIAGADTSGNLLYVSLLVGDSEDIQKMHSVHGRKRIHMSEIKSRKEKEAIVTSFKVVGNVFCACMRIDRIRIIQRIEGNRGLNPIRKIKLENRYNYALRKKISDILENFLIENKHTLETIEFQVDSDLQKSFRSVGLNCCDKGKAHELADVIGWANNGGMTIPKVSEFDCVKDIENLTVKGA
jgi:hypothetical protein